MERLRKNRRKGRLKNLMIWLLLSVLAISIFTYFLFSGVVWVRNIVPEFIGASLMGLVLVIFIKRNMRLVTFLMIFGSILFLSLLLFVLGRSLNSSAIIDIIPEFIGYSGFGLLLSLFFHKKMVM